MTPIEPVSIAGIEFDALIESEESYEADVPEYPTEKGFCVSDNMAIGAMELSMTLYLTATPITWRASHGVGEDRLISIPEKLVKLYEEREPISVYTQDKTYTDMVIKTISIKRDADTGVAREIPVTFQQIDITSSEKVEIPASIGKSGTTKSNSGTASTGTATVTTTESSSSDSDSSSESSSNNSNNSGSSGDSSSSSSGSSNNKTASKQILSNETMQKFEKKIFGASYSDVLGS